MFVRKLTLINYYHKHTLTTIEASGSANKAPDSYFCNVVSRLLGLPVSDSRRVEEYRVDKIVIGALAAPFRLTRVKE